MVHQQSIDRIESAIRQMQIDYERFFNGAAEVPPVELDQQIGKDLRKAHTLPGLSVAEAFRLNQLEARYNSYRELYNRRLSEREQKGSSARAAAAPREFDLEKGVVIGAGGGSTSAIEALYAGLCRGRDKPPRFDSDSFKTYLGRQVETIRAKTGCSQVRFRLVEEAGEVKLKAKPIRA